MIPTVLSLPFLREHLAALGIPPQDLRSVEITPQKVTAVHWRRDDDGNRVVSPDGEIATVTTIIAVLP